MAGPRSCRNSPPESPVQPDRAVSCWEPPRAHRTTNAETKTEVLPMAERASSHRTRARPKIWARAAGLSKCHSLYAALSRAACCEPTGSDPYAKHREALSAHERQLRAWADNCPQNFEDRAALVGAEI